MANLSTATKTELKKIRHHLFTFHGTNWTVTTKTDIEALAAYRTKYHCHGMISDKKTI